MYEIIMIIDYRWEDVINLPNLFYYSSMGTLLRADCKDQIKKVNALYNELFIEDWINHKLDDFLIV
jgi:hypothetical protein